jgi:hypothetical protein
VLNHLGTVQGRLGTTPSLIGPGQSCLSALAGGAITVAGRRGELLLGMSGSAGHRIVKLALLVVEHVLAAPEPALVLIQLSLMGVATRLGAQQLSLEMGEVSPSGEIPGRGLTKLGGEHMPSLVELRLVAVGASLLPVSDALVQVEHRLFLLELTLLGAVADLLVVVHLSSSAFER